MSDTKQEPPALELPQVTIPKEFSELVTNLTMNSLNEAINGQKLKAMIDENVMRVLKESVQKAFSYGSPFKKVLDGHIEGALPASMKDFNVTSMTAAIVQLIKVTLENSAIEWATSKVRSSLEELLQVPPEKIALSEVIREIVKMCIKEDSETRDQISATIDSDRTPSGWFSVRIKTGPYREIYFACDNKGHVYSIRMPYSGEITKQIFIGRNITCEKYLWGMHVGKTAIEKDISTFSVDLDMGGHDFGDGGENGED